MPIDEPGGAAFGWAAAAWTQAAPQGAPVASPPGGPAARPGPALPGSPRLLAAPQDSPAAAPATIAGPVPVARPVALAPPPAPMTAVAMPVPTPPGVRAEPAPVAVGALSATDAPPSADRPDRSGDGPPRPGAISRPMRAAAAMVGVLLVGSAWGIAASAHHADRTPVRAPDVAEFQMGDQDVHRFWSQG